MPKTTPDLTPERIALDAVIAQVGGKSALMRALNDRGHEIKSHNVIAQWQFNRVPAHYCPDIEALTGTPCEELRPGVAWHVLRKTARKVADRLRAIKAATAAEV